MKTRSAMTTPVPLRIDFVSDVACPWCAIGLASLQSALAELGDSVLVEIHLQPFELNPDMAFEGEDTGERLMRKYGFDQAQLEANRQTIRERAVELGIEIDLGPGSRSWSTFDAHRLLHWAGLQDRQAALALKRALFQAYFNDNHNVADHDVLMNLVEKTGLDREAASQVIKTGQFADEVREQERHFQQAGIRAVPATIINNHWLLQGGQPPEAFADMLREIAAKS